MRTLAIETSSNVGSIACTCHARIVCERVFREGLAHGRDLVIEMERCLRDAEWDKRDIELVAVSVGPGSYTGLRVGVAAAKTLAFTLGVPVIPVCSLDVIAENGPRTADYVAVVVDARRTQVYAALYANVGLLFFREEGPLLADPAEFARRLPRPTYVAGDALEKYRDAFTLSGLEHLPGKASRPSAANTGLLGEKAYILGERVDIHAIQPLYMRLPEAEEKWRNRQDPHADSRPHGRPH
jgi:tRNA threonylcarbamoyladenosine biosynthesis protein TsaB